MTIQILTWLNGVSALLLICSVWIMAIITLKFYFEQKNKRHINVFIFLAAVALGWTGITITFLSVAIYGYNLAFVRGIISYFLLNEVPADASPLGEQNKLIFATSVAIVFLLASCIALATAPTSCCFICFICITSSSYRYSIDR